MIAIKSKVFTAVFMFLSLSVFPTNLSASVMPSGVARVCHVQSSHRVYYVCIQEYNSSQWKCYFCRKTQGFNGDICRKIDQKPVGCK